MSRNTASKEGGRGEKWDGDRDGIRDQTELLQGDFQLECSVALVETGTMQLDSDTTCV